MSKIQSLKYIFACAALAFAAHCLVVGSASLAVAQTAAKKSQPAAKKTQPATIEGSLKGAKKIGDGVVSAYSKGGKTLLVLPKVAFERLFLWYAEYVSVPSGIVNTLDVGGSTVRFQRRGKLVYIRDLTATFGSRTSGRQTPKPGQEQGYRISPVELSVRRSNEPPIIGILPVIAIGADGSVLVDITKLFSSDIETLSARPVVAKTGLIPAAVNPNASYITSVRVFAHNFGVRTHLTFVAKNPKNPIAPPRGVSLRIGHSLVMLPEKPMAARTFDPRVGFFYAGASVTGLKNYTVYGTKSGGVATTASIMRYRLEKKDPTAVVSDPVKPIVFYIGREVPDRWRAAIKAGIEMWRPAFKSAGFSNAIVARNAPSFKDDPNWTPEDARFNVVRWLAQPNPNARGPHVVDPRSGEILSSHVEVWPQVISIFSRYYYGVMSPLDKRANTLPLSQALQAQILQYAVAHEVGHAIGLRHNHLASTAFTVAQMRDPKFANKWGANSSIMAYGRFNQAAQPGDGITKFIPGLGPYDHFAVKWGYGVFGRSPEEGGKILSAMVDEAQKDRRLRWAAGELPGEKNMWGFDPRVVKENTGVERVEATRLGIANLSRSLKSLPSAAKGDMVEFAAAFDEIQNRHLGFLKSVATLIGGVEAQPWSPSGPKSRIVTAQRQREAVQYLLSDGAFSLNIYNNPASRPRPSIIGVRGLVSGLQSSLVKELFDGSRLTLLSSQKAEDPNAYGVLDLANDSYQAIWGNLTAAPHWQRSLQRAHLNRLAELLKAESTDNAKERQKVLQILTSGGTSTAVAVVLTANGTNTILPGWVRSELPKLAKRLERAAKSAKDPSDRLHFLAMAHRTRKIVTKN